MALLTALDILQRAADELGLDRPVSTAGGDAQARQLHAALNATGRDLMRVHAWGALQRTGAVTLLPGETDYALPSDHHRLVSDTVFDETGRRRVPGPHDPQAEPRLRAGAGGRSFRPVGAVLRILPTPEAGGDVVSFTYVSKAWARSASGIAREEMEGDTDTALFSPDLLVKGTKWRFMAAKGMYADALRMEFESLRDREIAADLGGTILVLGGARDGPPFVGLDGVADADWSL
ncbi:MAG: hypothetical protein ABW026_06790 [Microvirga sp.]